jgi:hypothetical protein
MKLFIWPVTLGILLGIAAGWWLGLYWLIGVTVVSIPIGYFALRLLTKQAKYLETALVWSLMVPSFVLFFILSTWITFLVAGTP